MASNHAYYKKHYKNMLRLGILDLTLLIRSIRLNWGYEFWYMIDHRYKHNNINHTMVYLYE